MVCFVAETRAVLQAVPFSAARVGVTALARVLLSFSWVHRLCLLVNPFLQPGYADKDTVSQYADGTGQPNIDKLVLIARYFDVSMDYLSGIAGFERVENKSILAKDLGLSEQSVNIGQSS